jgi:hypothetical protein
MLLLTYIALYYYDGIVSVELADIRRSINESFARHQAYCEYLEGLCRQTRNMDPRNRFVWRIHGVSLILCGHCRNLQDKGVFAVARCVH